MKMVYYLKRLSAEERAQTHKRYLCDFPAASLDDGFEHYPEVLQLIEKKRHLILFSKVIRAFDLYVCYFSDAMNPGMELRAWIPGHDGIEVLFRQQDSQLPYPSTPVFQSKDQRYYEDLNTLARKAYLARRRAEMVRESKDNFPRVLAHQAIDLSLLKSAKVDSNCLPSLESRVKDLIDRALIRPPAV